MKPLRLPSIKALKITVPSAGVLLIMAINNALTAASLPTIDWDGSQYDGLNAVDLQSIAGPDVYVCYDGNVAHTSDGGNKRLWQGGDLPLRDVAVKGVHLASTGSDATLLVVVGFTNFGR